MYEELIQHLRYFQYVTNCHGNTTKCATCQYHGNICGRAEYTRHEILGVAADAITALQSENVEKDREIERLKNDVEGMRDNWYKCSNNYQKKCRDIKVLESALSRMKAERDALLEYANAQMECEMCKNDTFCPMENPMPENCVLCKLKPKCPCHPCKWEWCGAQGEG